MQRFFHGFFYSLVSEVQPTISGIWCLKEIILGSYDGKYVRLCSANNSQQRSQKKYVLTTGYFVHLLRVRAEFLGSNDTGY